MKRAVSSYILGSQLHSVKPCPIDGPHLTSRRSSGKSRTSSGTALRIRTMKHSASFVVLLLFFAGHPAAQDSVSTDLPQPGGIDSFAGQAEEPYDFVSSGSAVVVPAARYAAGPIKRWFFGTYYRDIWTTPIEVPVIDLEKTAGGLTPLDRGGGNQTSTLHLKGGDGHYYDLRSVDKSVRRSLPEKYHGTLIEHILQDQISSLNPVGAQLVPPLARAAGILHPAPTLVLIPDDLRLGEFREEFGGMLALFERDADESQADAARFGFSHNIIGSEKLLEKLRENSANRIDERSFVRARLFDMLIGDWDRHEGQWRWAEFESDGGIRFVPVPVDRDGALSKFDGLLMWLARLTGKMFIRRMTNFGEEIPDVFALNWQGYRFDRRLATSLTRDDWAAIADSLAQSLSDEVIDHVVGSWPAPVYKRIGAFTARSLKSRRDLLPSVASRYYDVLADTVEVFGSAADERFEITRLNENKTRVTVARRGAASRIIYSRVFHRDETHEVRLHGFGGNDEVVRHGRDNGLPVHVVEEQLTPQSVR